MIRWCVRWGKTFAVRNAFAMVRALQAGPVGA